MAVSKRYVVVGYKVALESVLMSTERLRTLTKDAFSKEIIGIFKTYKDAMFMVEEDGDSVIRGRGYVVVVVEIVYTGTLTVEGVGAQPLNIVSRASTVSYNINKVPKFNDILFEDGCVGPLRDNGRR